jgi:hypothetical protein
MIRSLVVAFSLPYAAAVSVESAPFLAVCAKLAGHALVAGPLEYAVAIEPERVAALLDALLRSYPQAQFGIAQAIVLNPDGLPMSPRSLVRALLLARIARSKEVFVHRSAAELFATCSEERVRTVSGRRIRGRLFPRQGARSVREPSYIGVAPKKLIQPGRLGVVRADPGRGGSRVLRELGRTHDCALLIAPAGASHEPLGALRHALLERFGTVSTDPLRSLLAGDGVPHEAALELTLSALSVAAVGSATAVGAAAAQLGAPATVPLGALLLDDASQIDAATLSVCAQLAQTHNVPVVVRLDATELVPTILSALPRAGEHDVCPLSHAEATRMAQSMLGGASKRDDLSQLIEVAGIAPVNVVQAVLAERTTHDAGDVRPVERWFLGRLRRLAPRPRRLAQVVALMGAAVSRELLRALLDIEEAELADALHVLEQGFFTCGEHSVRLCFASTRDWILRDLHEAERMQLHSRAAETLVERERALEVSEAIHHFSEAGDNTRAAEICLLVARRATELGYDSSGLLAFARELDPEVNTRTSEHAYASMPVTLALLQEVMVSPDSMRSVLPGARFPSGSAMLDEDAAIATALLPPKVASASPRRLSQKPELRAMIVDAIKQGNWEAAERWIDALAATAKSTDGADRLRALVRLLRGDDGNALRILKTVRSKATPGKRVCQAETALAYVYLEMGRFDQARYALVGAVHAAKSANESASLAICTHLFEQIAARAGVQHASA